MAAANTTSTDSPSWIRDPVADANPELPRKRERLSEEAETSPLSTGDGILVEALPPEEFGTSYDNAIELHDEPVMTTSFSDDFLLVPVCELSPVDQLNKLNEYIGSQYTLDVVHIDHLARWVTRHVDRTQLDSNLWREGYLEEHEFFAKLGEVCLALLEYPDDLFDEDTLLKYEGKDKLGSNLNNFIPDLVDLSTRFLTLLPEIVDRLVARRDSGQVPKTRQRIDFICYVQILADIMALHRCDVVMHYLRNTLHLKPKAISRKQREFFESHLSASAALVSLLQKLTQYHREVSNAWEGIDAALRIFRILPPRSYQVQQVMDTAHHCILPIICEKHPRALPDGFHENFIALGADLLLGICSDADLDATLAVYDRYIKGEDDALFPGLTNDMELSTLLQDLSNSNIDIMHELMITAWTLKALKAFIYSDIMDVRSCGIAQLSAQLLRLYKVHQTSKEGFEHPVLQYVARFMRSNELTKYIFGPNSHASLVNHSQNIIGFLAATSAYTDLETDIIWHACTNSVEAEFVKASFGVLGDLYRYLDLDNLLYLANKYAVTSPSKLGKDAVESLTDLFQRVQIRTGESPDQRHRLATAFISINIMMQISEVEQSGPLLRLRDIARSEIERFTDPSFSADDRIQIYSRCVPAIVNHSQDATTSIQILVLFLRTRLSAEEAQTLLGMLPVQVVVDELGQYVNSRRTMMGAQHDACISAIGTRLEAIIRLMGLLGTSTGEDIVPSLFRYTVGELALSNDGRERAWQLLLALAKKAELSNVASELLRRFLSEEAANLPVNLVTPELIKLLCIQLRQDSTQPPLAENFSLVLETAIWKKLIETAESSVPLVSQLASQRVCEILFEAPSQQGNVENAIKCHAAFASQQITRIVEDVKISPDASEGSICQKLTLLHAVLERSRQSQQTYASQTISELCLAAQSDDELIHGNLRLYVGGQADPKPLRLQIKPTNTLSDLLDKLPTVTGASDNRIIFGGKQLDVEANAGKKLLELGVDSYTVVSICPRHTFASNLEIVLTTPGPVEREILSHYDELESLLEGPDRIAQQVYMFLTQLRVPVTTRTRFVSGHKSTTETCPPAKPWKSIFSFFVLRTHLVDFAKIGVAERSFLHQGIELLIDVLTDKSRILHFDVMIAALGCLVTFLLEEAGTGGAGPINDPAVFASRMIDICLWICDRPCTQAQESRTRIQLADSAFRALQQAFRRQPAIWQCYARDPRAVELHSRLFFDHDEDFAIHAIATIRNFCIDPTSEEEAADFYLEVVLDLLPQGLTQRDRANQFFDLATDVLVVDRILRRDEVRVRAITASLTATLLNYEHVEAVSLPILDTSVAGLLRLLIEVVTVVKSFKKPIDIPDFSLQLFGKLLFPPCRDPSSRPLVHHHSRRLALQLVQSTCESPADFAMLLDATTQALHVADKNPCATFPGLSNWLRPASQCSGLPNLGMTCYMNSLLQQLYANVHFRKFILEMQIVDAQRQALLAEVQSLFAKMQDSYSVCADTSELAKVLNIQTDSQEDVHGFYEDFLSRLEANMLDADSKAKLVRFFTGKLLSQIKGECGHVSPKTEPFVDLPVIVKNKACLPESLDEFVQGEPMEGANKYKCLACDTADGGRLVNAMRRSCLEEMPDNLTFCLKRFTFEAMLGLDGKVNDRFDFPQFIDMSKYQQAHLEDPTAKVDEDVYELVGVIVHQGTLHLGHYWSYTLLRNTAVSSSRTWVKLEDRNATLVQGGLCEVQQECSGGQRYSNGNERADNAYVLFYQRKSSVEEPLALPGPVRDPTTQVLLPPKVPVHGLHNDHIYKDNDWRHRIAHLFDDDFAAFVSWLLSQYHSHRAPSPASSDCGSPKDASEPSMEIPVCGAEPDLMQKMSETAMAYIQRVAVCDPAPITRLRPCVAQLKKMIDDQPGLVVPLMQLLFQDDDWFQKLYSHSNKAVRTTINGLVIECIQLLRSQDPAIYQSLVAAVVRIHAALMMNPSGLHLVDLASYCTFIGSLAGLGAPETVVVLDHGYWLWALEMLTVTYDPAARKRFPGVWEQQMKNRSENVAALYELLFDLLHGYADISDYEGASNEGTHTIAAGSVPLTRYEINMLFDEIKAGQYRGMLCWLHASRFAEKGRDWRDSAPGRLLGLLVSPQHTDLQLQSIAESYLVKHIDVEDHSVASLFTLVLHFYSNCDELVVGHERAFLTLVKTIHQWDGSEMEFLKTVKELYELAPCTVLNSFDGWTAKFLENKPEQIRLFTGDLLRSIFMCDPISGQDEVDGTRANQARKLAGHCSNVLYNAFEASKPRSRYTPMIGAVTQIATFLKDLKVTGKAMLASEDKDIRAKISPRLRHELDEITSVLNDLAQLEVDVLQQWVLEPTYTNTTLQDVRASVELPASDFESGTESWADDDSVVSVPR